LPRSGDLFRGGAISPHHTTKIAAYNITKKTLHSLLRLPIKTQQADLSASTLQALQLLFKNCQFLIINKKLMINLKSLFLINNRLQAILLNSKHCQFKGLNVLLCRDFFQLLLINRRALYSFINANVEAIKG
jgi:hypothetical protein